MGPGAQVTTAEPSDQPDAQQTLTAGSHRHNSTEQLLQL